MHPSQQLREAECKYDEACFLAMDRSLRRRLSRLWYPTWRRVDGFLADASKLYTAANGDPTWTLKKDIDDLRNATRQHLRRICIINTLIGLVALIVVATVMWCVLLFPRSCCLPTPTRTVEPTATATVTPTPIEVTITCGDGVALPIRFGEPIILSYRNVVIINLSRAPVESDSVPNAGYLRRVSSQEFTYSHNSLDFDMLNFTFPAENEGGQPANKAISITFVPESRGLCYR